jgi:hypothetical protein
MPRSQQRYSQSIVRHVFDSTSAELLPQSLRRSSLIHLYSLYRIIPSNSHGQLLNTSAGDFGFHYPQKRTTPMDGSQHPLEPYSNRHKPDTGSNENPPLHGGSMITIFPKSTPAIFSLIIFLDCPSCNQLYGLGDDLFAFCIPYDEMNMVGSYRVEIPRRFFASKSHYTHRRLSRANFSKNSLLWQRWVMCHTYPGR